MTIPLLPLSENPFMRVKQILAITVQVLIALKQDEMVEWIEANLPPPGKKPDGSP